MSIRLLILYFLLAFGSLKSQTLSTIFIDTLKIIVDNKTIYESNQTKLKFIPNNKDGILTLYNDADYKFNVKFRQIQSQHLNYLASSGEYFYINDSICGLSGDNYFDSETCSEINIHRRYLKSWDYNQPQLPEKFTIKLYYRLCRFAPIDTANYAYNYREGLWIGPDRGVEKVTVNYKNDKKQGIATAYYKNGTTYNVNFKDNIADNYGQGYWENYKSKFTYSLPNIVTHSCDSVKVHNHTSFYFSHGEKTKNIRRHNDLSVHSEKKGLQHDSIQYNAKGDFMELYNDTITIKTSAVEVHNFYRKNTDTLHSFLQKTENGYSKIAIQDITKIYYTRQNWQTITTLTSFLSFASALIVAPLISIQKGGFNGDRYKKVSLHSLGVMTLSISLGVGFSQKEYLLKPTKKNHKTWKIEYDAYE